MRLRPDRHMPRSMLTHSLVLVLVLVVVAGVVVVEVEVEVVVVVVVFIQRAAKFDPPSELHSFAGLSWTRYRARGPQHLQRCPDTCGPDK